MDFSFSQYKEKLREVLTLIPIMSQDKKQEAITYWNNVGAQISQLVHRSDTNYSVTDSMNHDTQAVAGVSQSLSSNYIYGDANINYTNSQVIDPLHHNEQDMIGSTTDDSPIPLDSNMRMINYHLGENINGRTVLTSCPCETSNDCRPMLGDSMEKLVHPSLPPIQTFSTGFVNRCNPSYPINITPETSAYSTVHNSMIDNVATSNLTPSNSERPNTGNMSGSSAPTTYSPVELEAPMTIPRLTGYLPYSDTNHIDLDDNRRDTNTVIQPHQEQICGVASNDAILSQDCFMSSHGASASILDPSVEIYNEKTSACSASMYELQPAYPAQTYINYDQTMSSITHDDISMRQTPHVDQNNSYHANQISPCISGNENEIFASGTCDTPYQNPNTIEHHDQIDNPPEHTFLHEIGVDSIDILQVKRELAANNGSNLSMDQHKCANCSKQFSSRGNLKRHLKSHYGSKPFACDHCFSRFTEKKSLKIHLRIHTGDKPFKCELCHVSFSQKAILDSHIARHNNNNSREFICDKCGKAFRQRSQLKLHLMRHDGIKRLVCPRNGCDARFVTKGDLERHYRTHTGERPFNCPLCTRTFTRQQSLNEHINRHNGAKPYDCKYCEKTFSEMSACYKHIKTHERQIANLTSENQDAIYPIPS